MSHAPAPEAKANKATQYIAAAPLAAAKVDAAAGVLRDVAIMSIGEAAGHGCDVDMATLTKLFELTQGKTVKAFLNHSWNPSPDEVVGVFSGIYIDAAVGVLRAAQFQALGAFRTHNAKAYDTLFELAEIAPDSFGVSVSIYQDLAWKLSDGTEMLTDGWGNKPEKAVGDHPFIRPTFIESADFVSSPAANTALFSREPSKKNVDAEAESLQQHQQALVSKNSIHNLMRAIYAHFKDNPKALSRACQLAAEAPADKPVAEDEVIAKVDGEMADEAAAAVIKENEELKAKVTELEAKIAELSPKAEKEAELSKKNEELTAQLAQINKTRARFGHQPINTGKPEGQEPKTLTRAEFNALDHSARNAHMAAGGKLTE